MTIATKVTKLTKSLKPAKLFKKDLRAKRKKVEFRQFFYDTFFFSLLET